MRHALCDMRLVSCCTGVKSVPLRSVVDDIARWFSVLQYLALCCRELHCVAGCFRVFQGVAGCCRVLQCCRRNCKNSARHGAACVDVCCSVLQVLQCVAVC